MADNFSDEQLVGYTSISLGRVAYDNYRLTEEVKQLKEENKAMYEMILELKRQVTNLGWKIKNMADETKELSNFVNRLV